MAGLLRLALHSVLARFLMARPDRQGLEREGLWPHSFRAMLISFLRFFQRYAFVFALFAGVCARHWLVPEGGQWWLELGITIAAGGAVYLLLYKDGVTANRRGTAARLRVIEIIGFSIVYWIWIAILLVLLLFLLFGGDPPADWRPFEQKIDWPTALAIAALMLAAVVYALGLRAAIRKRRRHSFLN